jgi:hypothetical protein
MVDGNATAVDVEFVLRSRAKAITCAPNTSLISNRSMSAYATPRGQALLNGRYRPNPHDFRRHSYGGADADARERHLRSGRDVIG